MMGLLGNPAASMDGGVIWRAAEQAGLPTDNQTLNEIVKLINEGDGVDDAAKKVKAAKKSGGLLKSSQPISQPAGGK